ncbi:MAG: 2-succinyl-5-enolpyruvyl-6-hydroxy-3-cyclohexene-1-carboxylic-acid synthase [Bacteroidota bacterium]|nr:2-succinyl-5-enolpyruvyl-6-hydroxy-3-cyclohexene-1-carboxylic-acid synthase [Bacteroidota bacterium]
MRDDFPNINTLWAEVFVDELARNGVRHAVAAPGSRSAPLVLAFSNHPDIVLHTVIDERAAGFFALGLAKGGEVPVALLSTSGTAIAHFLPAVCEADVSGIPLIVLTADRPVHLRDTGALQTMNQARVYGEHARCFFDMPQPEADAQKIRALRSTACYAVSASLRPLAGPVHLNFPFRKPLEPTPVTEGPDAVQREFVDRFPQEVFGRTDGNPWTCISSPGVQADPDMVDKLEDIIRSHRHVLVSAGPDPQGKAHRRSVGRFSRAVGVPVFAEASSQLRYGPLRTRLLISTPSFLLWDPLLRDSIRPGLILHLGAYPTPGIWQSFIAENDSCEQVRISPNLRRVDPEAVVAMHVHAPPAAMLEALAERFERRPHETHDKEWALTLQEADAHARAALDEVLAVMSPDFYGLAYRRLADSVPDGSALVVSNSMPIRDMDMFLPVMERDVDVFVNRGVSGVDGMISTALGISRARGTPTILLIGDIAFLHDLDGLLAARRAGAKLTIVVVNNDGGGIFHHLPIHQFDPPFTERFATPHGIEIAPLVRSFGFPCMSVQRWDEYIAFIAESENTDGVRVAEVRADRTAALELRERVVESVMSRVRAVWRTPLARAAHVPRAEKVYRLSWKVFRGGKAPPAVLLHGFTRDRRMWDPIAPQLAEERDVYAFDLPGHGESPSPADKEFYTYERFRLMFSESLDRTGARKIHLLGYSLGGRLALRFALDEPDRVATLVLVSTTAGIVDPAERAARYGEDRQKARALLEKGLEPFIDAWIEGPLFSPASVSSRRTARQSRLSGTANGFARSLEGVGQGAMEPLWERLREIRFPLLVLAGERDERYVDGGKCIHERVPSSRFVIVPGVGHDIPTDRPTELAEYVRRFWSDSET